ncbi:MAG: nucleotidyltransferase domain-containing protein [Oscillospiraceae bacterium]|nr:nucleotidyltransferase domain-containing protein [Oscillospiraceae bacterium]
MKEIITAKLSELEKVENIRIVHAVESGSRAWGFSSPDSDFDVRFIYVRPKKFYLRLEKMKDVIEYQEDETLDINGWDLQKALRLLHGSNPTVFEWNNSPIVYKTTEDWTRIRAEIDDYFSCKAGLHHYLNMADRNYREYLKNEAVKLKKYFYVVRPLLACKWIMVKKCPPPMLFTELADAVLETALKPIIDDLLYLKKKTSEMGEGKRIEALNEYISENIVTIKETVNAMPKERKAGWDRLNELFFSVI